MSRGVLALVIVALLGGVWYLRGQIMTVHTAVPTDSELEVVIVADARTQDDPMQRLARSQVELCTAESVPDSEVVVLEPTTAPESTGVPDDPQRAAYRFVLRPGADAPDRDQLHGCLEDLQVRHLRLEVIAMTYRGDGVTIERDT